MSRSSSGSLAKRALSVVIIAVVIGVACGFAAAFERYTHRQLTTEEVMSDTSQAMKDRFLVGVGLGVIAGVAFGLYVDKQVYRR